MINLETTLEMPFKTSPHKTWIAFGVVAVSVYGALFVWPLHPIPIDQFLTQEGGQYLKFEDFSNYVYLNRDLEKKTLFNAAGPSLYNGETKYRCLVGKLIIQRSMREFEFRLAFEYPKNGRRYTDVYVRIWPFEKNLNRFVDFPLEQVGDKLLTPVIVISKREGGFLVCDTWIVQGEGNFRFRVLERERRKPTKKIVLF
ncbi:MAG: hypothetical protein H7A53_06160 [Akkermansiaceae bacterium]|nr:hypothetical protein [Akkermansiaceae bacterium]